MRYHDGTNWTERTSSSTVPVDGAASSPSVKSTVSWMLRGTRLSSKFYILATLAIIVAVILVPWVAPAFERNSAAYEWTNRIGVLCLFGVVVPFTFMSVIWSVMHPEEIDSVGTRVIFLLMGPVTLAIFTWALWGRLLEALWLR